MTRGAAPQIIAFGEVIWDFFAIGGGRFERHVGGASANLAVGLVRRGVRVGLIGSVGDDSFGRALSQAIAIEGVNVTGIAYRREPTGMTFIERGPHGEPIYFPVRRGSADLALAPDDLPERLTPALWIVTGMHALLTRPLERALKTLLRRMPRARLAIDLNPRPFLWRSRADAMARLLRLAPRAHVIKSSVSDLARLDSRGPGRALSRLRAAHPRATYLVTRSAQPASVYLSSGEEIRVSSLPVGAVVDATGAGDAFMAGVMAARLHGLDWCHALENGHAAAAPILSCVGGFPEIR